ncbi:acetylglutamate kinase [Cyclobacterium amurskyense]|uniref:Acetylglutamate kinase n=1 Tax=Cyclobacterium amurskyense TaxID=320787 RepID=A0A0H4PLP1_9BACT|nr:acetylglutamate kinase [Cyclobacterium amurskyense]AKP53953.1 Acetylglutamate kinase [Cyclobacterium amurskyense]
MEISVIKIGGNVIDHKENCTQFLKLFANFPGVKVLVHGGGVMASRIGSSLGIVPNMHNGRRITDKETLDVVTMVYAGLINKNLVAELQSYGQNAIGLTGADGNAITSKKRPVKEVDFGFVGDVEKVNTVLLETLLQQDIAPVFSAITHDGQGQLLNTNADTIASEIATSLAKKHQVKLYFCFDKKGVLMDADDPSTLVPLINEDIFKKLLNDQVIHSGMIPKLENAFNALDKGVSNVWMGLPENLLLASKGENAGTIIGSK